MSSVAPSRLLRATAARATASCRPLRVLGSGVAAAIASLPSTALDRRLGLAAGTIERRNAAPRGAGAFMTRTPLCA